MRDDLNDRMSLGKRFSKLISLGLWSASLPQPDGQILERIQRLNTEIEKQIFDLYIPENQIDSKINQIKRQLYQEKLDRSPIKEPDIDKKGNNELYLGNGVSSWLHLTKGDVDKLKSLSLPTIDNLDHLADLVDTNKNRLIWLIFHEEFTNEVHYEDFEIKSGNKTRKISKPKPVMNSIQNHIKTKILDKLNFPNYVYGFIKNANILDNAKEHQDANSIVTMDIKNFFENISFEMVRKSFFDIGYSGQIATILALITTKQDYVKVTIGEMEYWSCSTNRHLPQGAVTSPTISNLVGLNFDKQLYKRSKAIGFKYTRYADDLTFSTKKEKANHKALLYLSRKTLELHGFMANPRKTKILFHHNQMQVTGINLNDKKPTVPRKWRRNLRAAVHQFRFIKDRELKDKEYLRIMGSIQHLKLTHPKKAKQYEISVNRYYQIN